VTRIGIDYTSAVRQGAGIGRYTRGLIMALAEIDRVHEYVLFSAGRDPRGTSWPPNFRLRSLPLTDRHLAILWQRLRLPVPVELFTGWVQILHSPDFVLPPTLGARTVLTVHDLSFMRHPECSSPSLLAYLLRAVPRSVRRADVLLADSESTRRDLVELLKVPEERVRVVYPGVEPRFVSEGEQHTMRQQDVLERYGIRPPYILGLGTLQPRKNYPRLIRAYGLLRRRYHVPHQLVIGGGRGWLHEQIDETIRQTRLHEDVRLIGYVADEDLPALYRAADVFAFPSLYEGFGIPVLEAMGCGTPVVTSMVSSLPEVAGKAALMVPPEDVEALAQAMWQLMSDQALRNDLVRRGYEQVKRFTWRQSAGKLLDIYSHIAGER
jgi:glycosyltransferase involved in cell wall biosynthesis